MTTPGGPAKGIGGGGGTLICMLTCADDRTGKTTSPASRMVPNMNFLILRPPFALRNGIGKRSRACLKVDWWRLHGKHPAPIPNNLFSFRNLHHVLMPSEIAA